VKQLLSWIVAFSVGAIAVADSPKFSTNVIDIGLVVSDVEKSAKFYTEALGFKELPGFEVPGDFAKDAGLTGGAGLKIRMLALGEGENTTKLKLVEVVGVKSPKAATEVFESQTGYRYITLHVADTTAAVEQLEKAGVKTLAKTPIGLPKNLPQGVFLTCVKDPDGNFVELVGPKK